MAYSPSRLIDIIEKNKGKKIAAKKIIIQSSIKALV